MSSVVKAVSPRIGLNLLAVLGMVAVVVLLRLAMCTLRLAFGARKPGMKQGKAGRYTQRMLIALLLFGVGGLGLFVLVVYAGVFKVSADQAKAERNADAALDELFDGSPSVTFNGHMRSMKFATVVTGAEQRGYTLAHQAGDTNGAFTLIFKKTQ